jgi:catechol 2,3-dioxygenase-like lactoylglutathione lyase family enzyme
MQTTSNNISVTLDSISACVEDMEKAAAFLTDVMGWKRHPIRFAVNQETERSTSDAVFVDGNGAWLQLVSTEYPLNSQAAEKRNGTYYKLNFSTDQPDELQKCINNATTGEHRNIPVGVYEKFIEGGTNLISLRDQDWDHQEEDSNVPRIDRVAVVVEDIESSISFYTDVLGLKLHPMEFGVDPDANEDIGGFKPAFLFANSIWLVLIQPVGDGPLMDTLNEKGNGHILEVITEVDDLDAFYDSMKSKGVGLVCLDGVTPLTDDMKSQLLEPHGDKLAYIPVDVSQGMVIEVFQRGPEATSLIHQRDARG